MTTGKTIALTRWTFVGKVMSLLFNMLSRLVIAFLPRNKCLGSVVKNPLAKVGDTGDMGSIPGLGRSPGEGNGKPLQYSFLGNPSLSGYSPWVHEESDMPEHAHMSFFAPEIEE